MRAVLPAALAVLAFAAGCASSGPAGTPPPTTSARSSSTQSPPAPSATASPAVTSRPRVRAVLAPWRLPAPISRSVALDLGSGAFLAGGLLAGDHSSDQVLSVDPGAGTVRRAGALAQALHDSAGGVLAGRPYVVGGGGATELAAVQRASGRTWRTVGSLPGARSDLSVVSVGDALLVIGGYDGTQTPTSILRTTDGTHFTVLGHLPAGVRYAGVARIGRTVWVLGGEVGQRELSEVYRVDTASGHVTRAGTLPSPLGHEAVIPVGDRLLVVGGRTAPHRVTAAMWWYDTLTGRWSRAGRLPRPLADAPVLVRGAHGWLFGGETPAFTDAVVELSWR